LRSLILFLLRSALVIAAGNALLGQTPPPCGTPGAPSTYIDSLNGVIAYSNDSGGPIGCHNAGAYQWECVEFVQRYYAQRFGVNIGGVPVASQAFSILAEDARFAAYPQGSTESPKAEDIIVFGVNSNTPYGHVAIAKSDPMVQPDGSLQISIIEQNSYLPHTLSLQGGVLFGYFIAGRVGVANTAPVIGWVRLLSPSKPVVVSEQLDGSSIGTHVSGCNNGCGNVVFGSQTFLSQATGVLDSIEVFTTGFTTQSSNSATNTCIIKLYDVDSGIYLGDADRPQPSDGESAPYAYRGPGCAGSITFTFHDSSPLLTQGTHYRWDFVFELQNFTTLSFFGSLSNNAGGPFTGVSPIVNAEFIALGFR
jgi:hypothetical protein